MEKKDKRLKMAAALITFVTLAAYTLLMLRLFYLQTTNTWDDAIDIYNSDMKAYLQTMLGQESDFDFPYPVFFLVGRFFLFFTEINMAGALAAAVLNSLGILAMQYCFWKWLGTKGEWNGRSLGKYVMLLAASYSTFFISMLFAPEGIYLPGMTHKYLGVFSPNPFHNATYLATRPFAILAFFLFVRILDYYEERTDRKEFALFGGSLLLTTMTKPSYTLVLVSTAGLLMAYRLVRDLAKAAGTKERRQVLLRALWLTLAFVPTFLDLLYQFGGVFGASSKAGEEGGIGFGFFSAWSVIMENIPFAIVLALAFPGFVLLFHLKKLAGSTLYRFAWLQLVVSLLEFALLYEKGDRFVHMNFSWGYMHGIFFVFVATLVLLVREWESLAGAGSGRAGAKMLYLLEWLAYGWHLVCGIIYFLYIWSGQFYYCF